MISFFIILSALALILIYFSLYTQAFSGKKFTLGSYYILKKMAIPPFKIRTWKDLLLVFARYGFAIPIIILLIMPGKHQNISRVTQLLHPQKNFYFSNGTKAAKLITQREQVQDRFDEDLFFLQSLTSALPKSNHDVFISYGYFPEQKQKGDWIIVPILKKNLELPAYLSKRLTAYPLTQTKKTVSRSKLKVNLYYPIDIKRDKNITILSKLKNGQPIAIVINNPKQRILLWTSGISDIWGELGLSGYYLKGIQAFLHGRALDPILHNPAKTNSGKQILPRFNFLFFIKIAAVIFSLESIIFFILFLIRRKTSMQIPLSILILIFVIAKQSPAQGFFFQILNVNNNDPTTLFQNIKKETEKRTSIIFDQHTIKWLNPKTWKNNSLPESPYLWIVGCPRNYFLKPTLSNKITSYLKQGGILIASDCKNSKDFYYFLDNIAKRINPKSKGLQLLSPKHAIFRSFYLSDLKPIYGTDISYSTRRTSLLFLNFSIKKDLAEDYEMAIRTQINIIMFLLTGNYKKDQVHTRSILKRLKTRKMFR